MKNIPQDLVKLVVNLMYWGLRLIAVDLELYQKLWKECKFASFKLLRNVDYKSSSLWINWQTHFDL